MNTAATLPEVSEWWALARALFALLFVVALIYLASALARKYGLDKRVAGVNGREPVMSVVETLYLDPRRRLVLVRVGAKQHVLLLSQAGDLVVATEEVEAVRHAE